MYMYGFSRGAGKIGSESHGYNTKGGSAGFRDLEGLLRGNGT